MIFGAILAIDLVFKVPAVPILVMIFALCALIEADSMCRRVRMTWRVAVMTTFWTIIIICAAISIWIIERSFEHWAVLALAVIVPVIAQNIFAYFIGGRWLPQAKNNGSAVVRMLGWHRFHSSPRKAVGTAIVTSVLGLAVTLPWVFGDALLVTVAIVASLTVACGDILESYLKRLMGVEDSGEHLREGRSVLAHVERAMSSHGGFLDRFDSLFFCFAVVLPVVVVFLMMEWGW